MSLKERSTVADVGKGHTFFTLLRNSVTSSFNDKPFICSKMTNIKAFHFSLVSGFFIYAGVEKTHGTCGY